MEKWEWREFEELKKVKNTLDYFILPLIKMPSNSSSASKREWVLTWERINPGYQYWLGNNLLESNSAERDLEVL